MWKKLALKSRYRSYRSLVHCDCSKALLAFRMSSCSIELVSMPMFGLMPAIWFLKLAAIKKLRSASFCPRSFCLSKVSSLSYPAHVQLPKLCLLKD